MVGEQPDEELDPADIPFSFTHKPVSQRILIVASGPVFNFFLAIFIFYVLYQFSGIYLAKPIVDKVMDESPAIAAGIKPGDVIKEINRIKIESFEDISTS